jgi:hypothetical protein
MSRSRLLSGLILIATLLALAARAEEEMRPPVGGVASPSSAMIFYLAHGPDGACGPNCADWIAAEGVVEWDTFKRLLAFLARSGDRKVPVVLHVWGAGNLEVAMSLGKIIREHGLDVSVGTTVVGECANVAEAQCFALKRGGTPLDARIDTSRAGCDVVCVLILAGGVHRMLPANAVVAIGPTHIRNRLAPNVSEERQKGLEVRFGDRYRLYLTKMGVRAEIADIIDRSRESGSATQLSRDDWSRLFLVTEPAR